MNKPTALITRPLSEANKLKNKLEKIGIEGLVEPVMKIRQDKNAKENLAQVLNNYKIQAIIISSINGARIFNKLIACLDIKSIPVITVGEVTANKIRSAKFKNVTVCKGNIASVKEYIIDNLKPEDGEILYCSGNIVAADLQTELATNGFKVNREIIYRIIPIGKLSTKTVSLIKNGNIDYALFYSANSAAIFNRLAKDSHISRYLYKIDAFCLSHGIAKSTKNATWGSINIPNELSEATLIDLIKNFKKTHLSTN